MFQHYIISYRSHLIIFALLSILSIGDGVHNTALKPCINFLLLEF